MLSASQLECVRGDRSLFRGVTFALGPGGLLQVDGGNGSGKTSLMRLLSGLASPWKGEVAWCGEPVRRLGEAYRAEVFYLGHAIGVKEELTPEENLLAAARIGGESLGVDDARAALVEAGLAGREALPARLLSQGQKRRVALARLVTTAKRLWLLDEPIASLDRPAATWFESLLSRHLERGGMAVLSTHQDICTRSGSFQRLRLPG